MARNCFSLQKEILDQMARLLEIGIERARRCASFAGWDYGGFTGGGKRLADAVVSIVGLVGDESIGGHLQ